MIRPARTAAAAAAFALAAGLGGCITLFPKEKPAQLYRFEAAIPATQAAGEPRIAVRDAALEFDPGSSGDRILTVDGQEVAYVAGARWAVPAATLFEEAVQHAFATGGGRVRLVGAGSAKSDYRLVVQVTRFETRYLGGPAAAPTIVIQMHGALERLNDTHAILEKEIDAQAPATDNRVSAIVAAYDQATTQAVGDLVTWVNQAAGE